MKIGFWYATGVPEFDLGPALDAAKATVAYANAKLGGLDGHVIQLDACAEHGDATSATACANQFVADKVVAVVNGAYLTPPDTYIPILAGAHILWFDTLATSQIEFTNPYSRALSTGFAGSLAAYAQWANQHGKKSLAAIVANVPSLVQTMNSLGKAIFAARGVSLSVSVLSTSTPDPTPVFTAALAKHPDMIYWQGGTAAACLAGYQAIQTVDPAVTKLTVPTCVTPANLKAAGSASDGTLAALSAVDVGAESTLYNQVMTTYAPGVDQTDQFAQDAYSDTLALIRGVNQGHLSAGPVTGDTVIAALKAAGNVPLPLGAGATFSCATPIIAQLPSVCGGTIILAAAKNGNVDPTSVDLVNTAAALTAIMG